MTHVYVSKLGHQWLNWTMGTDFSDILMKIKTFILIQDFENVIYKMAVILYQSQCVKTDHFISTIKLEFVRKIFLVFWALSEIPGDLRGMIQIWSSLTVPLQRCHNESNGISNHWCNECLLNHLFRHRSKKISKIWVTGLCEGISPVTVEFPTHRASNAENVSIWWCLHDLKMS